MNQYFCPFCRATLIDQKFSTNTSIILSCPINEYVLALNKLSGEEVKKFDVVPIDCAVVWRYYEQNGTIKDISVHASNNNFYLPDDVELDYSLGLENLAKKIRLILTFQ